MKKIFTSPDSEELELLRNMLENARIICELRNGDVSRTFPGPAFYEEIWVSDEEEPKAAELVAAWQRPAAGGSGSAWTCPSCGERIEAQFSSCWKCGTERPTASIV